MSDIIGLIVCLALVAVIAFVVLRKDTPPPTTGAMPVTDSAKPLFKIIFGVLAWVSGFSTIFIFFGGPDGKFGSKESIINGFFGLVWTVLCGVIYRRNS